MGKLLFWWEILVPAVVEPTGDDIPVSFDLIQVVAAQPFITHRRDALKQEAVSHFQGKGRLIAWPLASSARLCHHQRS